MASLGVAATGSAARGDVDTAGGGLTGETGAAALAGDEPPAVDRRPPTLYTGLDAKDAPLLAAALRARGSTKP